MSDRTSSRLLSLDTLRGFDMLMIMGGSGLLGSIVLWCPTPFFQALAEQTHHVGWNGLHMQDCIFPLFLFIAGISFPFSLEKQQANGYSESRIHRKVIIRGLVLVFLGMLYNGLLQLDFAHQRYASVLGRIGLAWMFSALIFMHTKTAGRVIWLIALLLGYYLVMRFWPLERPDGVGWFDPDGTVARYMDQKFLPGRFAGGGFDAEGLFSTVPAIGTAMLGMLTGCFVKKGGAFTNGSRKTLIMIGAAAGLAVIGLLWSLVFPINKLMWTSSFVCVVGAISLLLFAVFYYIVDVRKWRRWTLFFSVIGMNSITIYLAQKFISFWHTDGAIFGGILNMVPPDMNKTFSWTFYICLCWGFLYFLYRKNVFLKV